jgi:hypothetical protein
VVARGGVPRPLKLSASDCALIVWPAAFDIELADAQDLQESLLRRPPWAPCPRCSVMLRGSEHRPLARWPPIEANFRGSLLGAAVSTPGHVLSNPSQIPHGMPAAPGHHARGAQPSRAWKVGLNKTAGATAYAGIVKSRSDRGHCKSFKVSRSYFVPASV